MKILVIIVITICIYLYIKKKQIKKNDFTSQKNVEKTTDNNEAIFEEQNPAQWSSSYQPRYLLTINEKQQYKKLKAWATTHNAVVFAKVRVLDLIEPRRGIENYKSLFYKIQAKHVDFVICDQEIKVKYIIEIDDNSHNNQKREERDNFLREALSGAGYKVLHTRYITAEFLNQL